MFKKRLILLSVLSGLLLVPGWFGWGHGLILAVAFIPLLSVEHYLCERKNNYPPTAMLRYAWLTFIVWNSLTIWWIFNASPVGMVAAILVTSFLQSLVFTAFHITRRRMGTAFGHFSLVLYWLAFEHFYFNAEITNPWLTLGYGFMYNIRLVQWYEFTGVLGGSFWVILLNLLIYNAWMTWKVHKWGRQLVGLIVMTLIVFLVPLFLSLSIYKHYSDKGKPVEIIVIQPNIDPYAKFVSEPFEQTLIQLKLAGHMVTEQTSYMVGPETSINNSIWLEEIEMVNDVRLIRLFLKDFPSLKYVTGAQCFQEVYGEDTLAHTARPLPGTNRYYQSYNAALQFDLTDSVQVYFKSQLVTGVEKMPYARFFRFMDRFIVNLGGTTRGWAPQKERGVFRSVTDDNVIAPVICWESVFGEFVTGYIKKGASLIFVITNDGWWGDTPGYRQHQAISCIRAIETRRSIARSANTGISSFINQRGDVLQQLGWWKSGALRETLRANTEITFYVEHGDYIGRIARFFSLFLLLFVVVRWLIDRKKR